MLEVEDVEDVTCTVDDVDAIFGSEGMKLGKGGTGIQGGARLSPWRLPLARPGFSRLYRDAKRRENPTIHVTYGSQTTAVGVVNTLNHV